VIVNFVDIGGIGDYHSLSFLFLITNGECTMREAINTLKNYGRHQLFAVIFLVEEEFEDTKRDNQNPSIEEEQTTQWPREKSTKGQTDNWYLLYDRRHVFYTYMYLDFQRNMSGTLCVQ
jgi:hypothetical protein